MQTILDLIARVEGLSDRGVRVYDRRGRPRERHSWAEVCRRSRATGAGFLAAGCEPGGHVFLQLPNSFELIEGFLGAVAVGLTPCCLAPPRALGGLDAFRERMRHLLGAFPNSLLVAQPDIGDAAGTPFIPPPDPEHEGAIEVRTPDPESLAFIQLTSGSTLLPKAVRITHRALVANSAGICASGRGSGADTFLSWLPLYHDMGLVGSLFCALYLTSDLHLMQPESFLASPRTWLRAISELPGPTASMAPNFAYQTCVQKIPAEAVAELDLSRWRNAGCGAERVRAATLDAFAERFAPAGFRKESFVPCYGLAEATLAVTYGHGERIPPVDDGNVSCGRPIAETEIAIRDRDGKPLGEGEQGEVTVRSPSLCSGYAGGFHPSPIRDGWLYTGDRGYLRQGELYITGR